MTKTASEIARLRILATSDVHMHLLPHDYFAEAGTPGKGLQALVARMDELRREAESENPPRRVLLVDNGDTLQGNALGDHLATKTPRGGSHPVAEVMNALGYDAMGLGNHDLDFGLDYLSWFARSLDAPLLSSNTRLEPARDWLSPHCLLTVGPVTVGVLSVLPPGTVNALHAQIGDAARFGEMIPTVVETARALREAGADIVLCLGHTGLEPGNPEHALADIARAGAVDALIGGHDHGVFPGPLPDGADGDETTGTLSGIPTARPGCDGAFLGCIDLDLERGEADGWTVTRGTARLVTPRNLIDGRACCAFDAIRPAHEAVRADLRKVIGTTPVPLHSYFAQVRPTGIHALIAAAQSEVIEVERHGTAHADLPLLSVVSLPRAGGAGGPGNYTKIPAGPLTARHLAELSIYANQVWAVRMTGAEIAEWLEKSASAFADVGGAESDGLIDPDFPAFDFDVIFGLSYEIDPSVPPRYDRLCSLSHPESRRITRLEHMGTPVSADMPFLVAVNSFRACGGGRFPGLHPDRPVIRPDRPIGTAIEAFVTSGARPAFDMPWRFAASCSGIRTWFDTGVGALEHLDDIAHLSPGTPDLQPSGFLRIPVTL